MSSQDDFSPGVVYFAGAGPGDAALLTIKAMNLIRCAQCILYAGSLIHPEVLKFAGGQAETFDTSQMKLEEQVHLMAYAAKAGKIVARLHSGDPALFGAIHEQMQALRRKHVPYAVIPGVSAAFAAAAALGIEYTLPETTQTVIFTRLGGRTPVPESERLRHLARIHSSLVVFLSMAWMDEVVEELLAAGYPPETAIAVVYRASWPDEQVIHGTIADIAGRVKQQDIHRQGLIIVSPALTPGCAPPSYLYGKRVADFPVQSGTAILAISAPAAGLGRRLQGHFPKAHLYVPERFLLEEERNREDVFGYRDTISRVMQEVFGRYQEMVCIMAAGIVVRTLAPHLKNKHRDAAVVVLDAKGQHVVSLISGHTGGANRLAYKIAGITEGQAIITTASDQQDLPALDILAQELRWQAHTRSRYAKVMACFINDQPVARVVDDGLHPPAELANFPWAEDFSGWEEAVSAGHTHLVILTCRTVPETLWQAAPESLVYHPPTLAVGVGCKRDTRAEEILEAVNGTLAGAGLARESVLCLATIEAKAHEPGLSQACAAQNWDLRLFSREQINQIENLPNPSGHAMEQLGVSGVAEPAAMLAAGSHTLLVEKQKYANVTVAVAVRENVG